MSLTKPRTLPHDLEAEESLLGAMLMSNDAVSDAVNICSAQDFYKPAHAHIFSAIVALFDRGEPIDAVTVRDELFRSAHLETVGDPTQLLALQANTPSFANAEHYATIVDEHSTLRRLIHVATEIAEVAFQAPAEVQETVDWAESQVFGVSQRHSKSDTLPWREWMVEELSELEKMDPSQVQGIPTGFYDLDNRLGGLQRSNLVIIGARPSMGKTALALGIAQNVAIKHNIPVLMFSLEMSSREIMLRLIGSESHIDSSRIRAGYGTRTEWQRINSSLSQMGEPPFFINDNPMASVLDIRAQARRVQAREGLGLIIVDYLQLMSSPKGQRSENRVNEVSQMSRGLKVLARELDVPVIALSQLNRGLESRDNKRPMLSDLRDSGALEQDADVVIFLYRQDVYYPENPNNEAELIIAKHRNGPTDTVRLAFIAREAAFRNRARDGYGGR